MHHAASIRASRSERSTSLEHRQVSDYPVKALTDAARQTITEHETLALSDRDRAAVFDALMNSPEPAERLARALADHARRITS